MPTVITGTDGINQVQAGAVESGDLPAGSVIQVVEGTTGTNVSSTSGTYIDSGLSASIVPQSAANKIFVICSFSMSTNAADARFQGTIFRNSTNIGGEAINGFSFERAKNQETIHRVSFQKLDAPSSVNSVTYSVYMSSGGGTLVTLNANLATPTITLMEIAG